MRHGEGAYRLWFAYLVLGLRNDLQIDENYYREWGDKRELLSTTFNKWWKQKGRAICAETDSVKAGAVSKVGKEDGFILLKVRTDVPVAHVYRQVGEFVREARRSRQTQAFSRFHPTGQVNYKTLAAYFRYLQVELDPRNARKTVDEKAALFREKYERIRARLKKQKETLQSRKSFRASGRLKFQEPDFFHTLDKSTKARLTGFSAKKAHRWSISGQLVMLNVAQGHFPGRGYFGAKIAERLRQRQQELGVVKTIAPGHRAGPDYKLVPGS